ncbi:type IX secretion system membrane protein PorP/SprF [Pontibacter sp. E15-1]|uniref:PorP/SprF family type IX secretion system membrane protein n=1 Tax=Pontibacter sp. E15-1 TaxID=2919918 RepID=UPI001F4F2252|nr:type IX secretion system membrane protein PorP/SprF [Pontibacter sp. E15-1]MCJ8166072.1 type IX secretion system membrane protein PorP/SprF [Pontibacter sp. E15-1]
MNKSAILLFLSLLASAAVAQQKALYSQYMTNYYLLNPAVSGYGKDLQLKAGYRNQWVGFEGAPSTFYLSGEGALFQNGRNRSRRSQPFHGAGGYVYKDVTGPTSRTGLLLSYAYHVPLSRGIFLSSGLFAGVQQYTFNANKIQLADGSNERDPVTSGGSETAFMPDLSVGTFLHSDDFYVGVSLFQVLGNRIFAFQNAASPSRLARHLFVSGGYNFAINRNFTLAPSVLVKYVSPAPLQTDVNVKGIYSFSKRRKSAADDKVWAGVSYRTQDALVALCGFQFLGQYELSYSYDVTVSPVRHYSSGSHEIMLGFRVK